MTTSVDTKTNHDVNGSDSNDGNGGNDDKGGKDGLFEQHCTVISSDGIRTHLLKMTSAAYGLKSKDVTTFPMQHAKSVSKRELQRLLSEIPHPPISYVSNDLAKWLSASYAKSMPFQIELKPQATVTQHYVMLEWYPIPESPSQLDPAEHHAFETLCALVREYRNNPRERELELRILHKESGCTIPGYSVELLPMVRSITKFLQSQRGLAAHPSQMYLRCQYANDVRMTSFKVDKSSQHVDTKAVVNTKSVEQVRDFPVMKRYYSCRAAISREQTLNYNPMLKYNTPELFRACERASFSERHQNERGFSLQLRYDITKEVMAKTKAELRGKKCRYHIEIEIVYIDEGLSDSFVALCLMSRFKSFLGTHRVDPDTNITEPLPVPLLTTL